MNAARAHGLTLLELMITLAVAALLLLIAVPAFRQLVDHSRLATQTNDLLRFLSFSRSEAIMRGRRVVLCPSADGQTCTSGWERGWIAFVDLDNDAAVDSPADTILQVHGALAGDQTLTGSAELAAYVSFTSEGAARQTDGSDQTGTFAFDRCVYDKRHTIVLGTTGHGRSVNIPCF